MKVNEEEASCKLFLGETRQAGTPSGMTIVAARGKTRNGSRSCGVAERQLCCAAETTLATNVVAAAAAAS